MWNQLHADIQAKHFEQRRQDLFSGEKINTTENRAVLHTALRNQSDSPVFLDGHDVMPQIQEVWRQIDASCNAFVGVTDLIHIGIGGSDFGPRLVCDALKNHTYSKKNLRVHFVSNIDGAELDTVLSRAIPTSTRVILVSKTFTTLETMQNAKSVINWLKQKKISDQQISETLYAVTANPQAAAEFGIQKERIFPFWEWVGGRFSVWSAVGLPIALQFGFDTYKDFLCGAYAMDQHFLYADSKQNQPLLLALAFYHAQKELGAKAQAIIPYAQSLNLFPHWLQQLEMESNGKTAGTYGQSVPFSSAVVFGIPGTNSQHSFFQMIHQGPEIIPVDFIAVKDPMSHSVYGAEHHRQLIANCLAQSQALATGFTHPTDPNHSYSGKRPNNLIWLPRLDAFHLGALLALYEHRTFCLGLLYGINSFDQPGVELGKKLAKPIDAALRDPSNSTLQESLHEVTSNRIQWLKQPF